MNNENSIEQEMAWRYIQNTSVNVFITGRAGTGKTTFLKKIVKECPKQKIVLAPTGVAAINAGGMTIHSFFQLPLGLFLPEYKYLESSSNSRRFLFQKKKLQLIRSLELIIIDEVSMLRADIVDEIDSILRRVRRSSKPFGGIQLLMIGDVQQLLPVVKSDEWEIMKQYYPSPYFFNSNVFVNNPFISIEFKHIYRQSDKEFISLLSAVRENKMGAEDIRKLNSRYIPNFENRDGYIILTTHNSTARQINDSCLAAINSKEYSFEAQILGTFPENIYPIDNLLTLKKGAQVMFTKNDPNKRYVNGTLAEVIDLDELFIKVKIYNGEVINVEPACWENLKYDIDNDTKEIVSTVIGEFYQYPLKTAWAITIHKSQGLTFDKAIIDAGYSFTHGQVYVALSRCRSLEGIVLKSQIPIDAIINDNVISTFSAEIETKELSEEQLDEECRKYFLQQLKELFACGEIQKDYNSYLHLANTIAQNLYPNGVEQWHSANEAIKTELVIVGTRFCNTLDNMVKDDYADNSYLQERVKKASHYFAEKISEIFLPLLQIAVEFDFDDKTNKKLHKQYLRRIINIVLLKIGLWKSCKDGFLLNKYLKTKSLHIADIEGMSDSGIYSAVRKMLKDSSSASDYDNSTSTSTENKAVTKSSAKAEDILNKDIFDTLVKWRKEKAQSLKIPAYMILHQKTLISIANAKPTNNQELLAIKGVGKKFIENYAPEILQIIEE